MSITQLSIFIENKVGRMLDVTGILKDANIDIKAMSLSDNADYGILRLIVSDPIRAYDVLSQKNIICKKTEVLAAIISHSPGALHDLLGALINNNINVEYMYVAASKDVENVVIILSVDKVEQAIVAIKSSGISKASLENLM